MTAQAARKTYDGTLVAAGTGTLGTLAGAGDLVNSSGSQAFTDKSVGSGNKTVAASGVTIKDATGADTTGNYAIAYTNNTASTISQAALSVTADDKTKAFGATDPALTYQVTSGSLVGNDTLTGALTRAAGENAGRYGINTNALANGNYLITATNGILSIESSVELDNTLQSASQQVISGSNALASGSIAGAFGRNIQSSTQSAGLSPISTQFPSGENANISQIGGLIYIAVEDFAAIKPTAINSVGGVAPRSGVIDAPSFVFVRVVNGGIDLGKFSASLAR